MGHIGGPAFRRWGDMAGSGPVAPLTHRVQARLTFSQLAQALLLSHSCLACLQAELCDNSTLSLVCIWRTTGSLHQSAFKHIDLHMDGRSRTACLIASLWRLHLALAMHSAKVLVARRRSV